MKIKYPIIKGDDGIVVPGWFDSRYLQKKLGGWKDTYAYDDINTTELSGPHHLQAGDLSTRYNLMNKYINSGNVGKDIQSYANLSGITDINQFITDYNNNINTLNKFFQDGVYYKAADGKQATDATSHNQLYNKMFSSRSNVSDIGYQTNLQNRAGSSTWLRIPDQYEQEYENLDDAGKASRTHEVTVGGQKHKVVKNPDGTIKLLPTEAPKVTPTGTGEDQQDKPSGQSTTLQEDNLTLAPRAKSKYPGWSDWLPLTVKNIIDNTAALRTGKLERLKRFPKVIAPQEYAKVTNAYAQRQLLEKQKADVLHRSGFNPTSDLAGNLNARMKGEEIASQITDKQAALKSQEYNDTIKQVQDVANRNKMYSVNAANENMRSNAAAWNSILDSRVKQNERIASNLGTYVVDMYTNYGEYLKTKRLNENAAKRANAYNQFSKTRRELLKPLQQLQNSPQTWEKFDEFRGALESEGLNNLSDNEKRIWNEAAQSQNPYNNPEFVRLITNQLKNGTSAAAQRYRSLYKQDLRNLSDQVASQIQLKQDQLQSILASIDTYVTNQWGYNPENKVHKSVLSVHKSGGTIDPTFTRLERLRQKEQQSIRENSQRRNEMYSDNLNKQLDRISKEELALLRAIFK